MSRMRNLLRNAAGFSGSHLVTYLLQFACRTSFIYTLGKEYLGISSLYTNILTILNITELGFATAITYSLYEPLTKGDWERIRGLMAFFKKAYRLVGLAVLVFGLSLLPFLPSLMTGVTDQINIYHYYLLYLAQSVFSYWFFAYKNILLVADQKQYLSDVVACICKIVVTVLQILSLFILRSFLTYTVLSITMVLANNIATAMIVDRRYPQLRGDAQPLTKTQKISLFRGVYALFLQRISTAVGTATDNLIISAFVNVMAVGLYSNYHLILSTVQTLVFGSIRRITPTLGNYYTTHGKEKSEFLFRTLNLANAYLVCVCSVCFYVLFRPFITLWAGESYLLDAVTVAIVVLNFSTNYLQSVVLIFRNVTGLFSIGKYCSVINAILNLVISLVLVQYWGMTGVFAGSIISRLITNWWFDGWVICRKGFGVSPVWYYLSCVTSLLVAVISIGIVTVVCAGLPEANWLALLPMAAVSVLVPTAFYILIYFRSPEFACLYGKIKAIIYRDSEKY